MPKARIATFSEDMTSAQFYATIAALVLNGNEITDLISMDKPSFYAFLGNLYDTDTLILTKHPLIAGIGINGRGRLDDLDLNPEKDTRKPAGNKGASTLQTQTTGSKSNTAANNVLANSTLARRDLQPANAIEETVQFEDSSTGAMNVVDHEPFALQWLGSLWAQNALRGNCEYIIVPTIFYR